MKRCKWRFLNLALAALLLLSMTAGPPAMATEDTWYWPIEELTDVNPSDYYYDAVAWAMGKGIGLVGRYTNPQFGSSTPCTRLEVADSIWAVAGCPAPQSEERLFYDVPRGSSAWPVLWAAEQGITNGTAYGRFSPDLTCTRGQIVTFLWRANGSPEVDTTSNPFSDVRPSDYFYKPVLWAVDQGITAGTGHGRFSPNQICTRVEIITMMHRDFEIAGNEVSPVGADELPRLPDTNGGVKTDAPGMAFYGLEPTAELGVDYPYTTACFSDKSLKTTGTVRFDNYSRRALGNGYDEITISVMSTYSDENARTYGLHTYHSVSDYYLYEEGGKDADLGDEKHNPYCITYQDVAYDACSIENIREGGEWTNGVFHYVSTFRIRVPHGYDGIVIWIAGFPSNYAPGYTATHLSGLGDLIAYRCR